MKKLVFAIFLFLLISACKDDKTHQITDFTQPRTITVEPYENFSYYAMMNIWIKGNVDDTVLVKLHSKDRQPILKLSGNIDERWYTDYYGNGKRTVIFEPYKATKGNLEIRVKL